ncbi:Lpg1974 family pore-forming outer membrane protein [Aquibium sp. ELW1220]|uniref:Lpg1974 family pore-forming outer membrane protein n=1 Tax=Aquibium sp. ELW1220 TaxID=2976766 RepID=UPI0025B0E56F|nr:Lpg1974 family pore-forming outer membrane protein [Aquibium sp. ELW1220]MDN2578994.1 Lpg1974 family pore-forming outer membrane protein [Aquibium sp. ELW1220]
MERRDGMSGRTIKLVAAGAAAIAAPAVASADDSYPSLEIMTEGGLTLSDYSKAIGKVGGPLDFGNDMGGYGAIAVGRAFDASSPYDWRITGTVTQFLDNEESYGDNFIGGIGTVSQSTSFGMQSVDFDIGRRVQRNNFEARFFAGVRGMHLKLDQGSDFSASNGNYGVAVGKVGTTEFLGAGPRVGVEARLGGTWGVVGAVSGSAMYGQRKNGASIDYQIFDDLYQYNVEYGESQNENDWLAEITGSAGVSFKPNDGTEVIVGYRGQQLWNVTGSGEGDDILIHGPFVGLKLKF